MKNLRIALVFLISVALINPLFAGSSTITVKDSAGATQTYDVTTDVSGNFLSKTVTCDQSAGANCVTVTGSNALKVDGSAVTQPVSAASLPLPSGAATSAKQPALGSAGTAATDVISVQGISGMTAIIVDGSAVTQPVSAVALPLPSGASTSAKQAAPGTAGSASADVLTVQGIASMTALKVDGSAVTQPVSGTGTFAVQAAQSGAWNITNITGTVSLPTGASTAANQIGIQTPITPTTATATNGILLGMQYNSTQATFTNGQQGSIQGTSRGAIYVATGADTFTVSANAGTNLNTSALALESGGNLATIAGSVVSQGTALGSIKNTMVGGSVTTNAPTYTTGQINPFSLTTAGGLRVDLKDTASNTNNINVNIAASAASNISINEAQINGVAPLMGNGVTGTGSQRVTIASDNSAIAGMGIGATGSAVPANAVYQGGASSNGLTGQILCDNSIVYDASTSGSTQLVALSSGKVIYVCRYDITTGGTATNVKLVYGTGSNCVTSPSNMTPAYQLAANSGITGGMQYGNGMKTAASNALCINASAGNAVQATVYYTQF